MIQTDPFLEVIKEEDIPHINCAETLSTVCSVCTNVCIRHLKYNGAACTTARCKSGFWTGGQSWNRLFFEIDIEADRLNRRKAQYKWFGERDEDFRGKIG